MQSVCTCEHVCECMRVGVGSKSVSACVGVRACVAVYGLEGECAYECAWV